MVQQGVYVGNSTAALGTYDSFMGHTADNVLNYLNDSSWSAFDDSIGYEMNEWKGVSENLILSVPLVVQGSTLDQAAAGNFDAHYLKAATALAASQSGTGPIYVRVGWEFNGSWMPWAAQGHEASFIKAYQNLVDQFRSVSDRFKFVWDVNIDQTMDPATAYPGDKYVDVVGMDAYYSTQYHSSDPQTAFNDFVNQKYGLQWQQDFAAAHGKQTAISEWGVQTNNSGPFIQDMANWMNTHNMVYENYWDSNAANYPGELDQGEYPDAARAFKAAFPARAIFTAGNTTSASSSGSTSGAASPSSTSTTTPNANSSSASTVTTTPTTISSTSVTVAPVISAPVASVVPAVQVDTTPPAPPGVPVLAAGSDTGASSTDGWTRAKTPTLTGTTEAGATVTLYNGTTVAGTTRADGNGAYAVTSAALSDGYHALRVTATDASGNTSALSNAKVVIVDTIAPLLYVKTKGTTTGRPQVAIAGTGEANAIVTLTDNGKIVGSTTVAGNGTWSSTIRFANRGANSIVATEVDLAGNATASAISFRATSTSLAKLATAAASMPSSGVGAMSARSAGASSLSMLAGAHR